MKTANFHGRRNKRRITALNNLNETIHRQNKELEIFKGSKGEPTQRTVELISGIERKLVQNRKEKKILEERIKPEEVANSFRSKKSRTNRAGVSRNR